MNKIKLIPEVKVGDILTSVTIVISLVSILISWSIDRDLRRTQEVDKIRKAAAATFAKLERASEISLSIFELAQHYYVEAAEIIAKESSDKSMELSVMKARDFLWKSLNSTRDDIRKAWYDEEIDTGYEQLLSYYPVIRNIYRKTIKNMRNTEDEMLKELLSRTETDIMMSINKGEQFQTALLGNKLRKTSAEIRTKYSGELNSLLYEILSFLTKIIEADNSYLLNRKQPMIE